MDELIQALEHKIDRVKYYHETVSIEELELWLKIVRDSECLHTPLEDE